MLDLDHFKQINDRHGHDTGDQVLVRVAETLRAMRSTEVPARWGGEEFVIVLPATAVADAVTSMDRVRERLSSAVRVEGEAVTFSAGVAPLDSAEEFERAVAAADEALYRAKSAGRDRVEAA
jgi:diguanylate cyclase (GGDEF)-like protein